MENLIETSFNRFKKHFDTNDIAIISACRSLDELDVYIDCLDKNEVDDFKIFNIRYELSPAIAGEKNSLWKAFFQDLFAKREKPAKVRFREGWGFAGDLLGSGWEAVVGSLPVSSWEFVKILA